MSLGRDKRNPTRNFLTGEDSKYMGEKNAVLVTKTLFFFDSRKMVLDGKKEKKTEDVKAITILFVPKITEEILIKYKMMLFLRWNKIYLKRQTVLLFLTINFQLRMQLIFRNILFSKERGSYEVNAFPALPTKDEHPTPVWFKWHFLL